MNPASTPLILHNLFSKLPHFIPQCRICFCECCYFMSLLGLWELPGKFRAVPVRAREMREVDELVRGGHMCRTAQGGEWCKESSWPWGGG